LDVFQSGYQIGGEIMMKLTEAERAVLARIAKDGGWLTGDVIVPLLLKKLIAPKEWRLVITDKGRKALRARGD
jgi:hypothetical protein